MTFRVIDGGMNRTSPPQIAPSASPMTELGDFLRTHVRRAERDARTIERLAGPAIATITRTEADLLRMVAGAEFKDATATLLPISGLLALNLSAP